VLGVGVLGSIAYLTVCLFVYFQQPKYIYAPSHVIEKTPALYNLPFDDVWLPTTNKDERIHGWWIGSNHPDGRVLLYLHGNALNVGANIYAASGFQKAGFSVFLIDYRGFGRSEGPFPNEKRIYEDAQTAWNYLVQRKIAPSQIYIYGHSLGGAVAIDLAVKHPQAAGLIVESSFTSVQRVTAAQKLFLFFPVKLLLTQKFESINKVPNLKMPVLFIHGINDSTIPVFMSKELYAAAPKPKELILVPGADHNNVGEIAPSKYLKAVQSFIQVVESNRQVHKF
jgi:fermentation-respiration switch protein FrsA (DUF1100 family)